MENQVVVRPGKSCPIKTKQINVVGGKGPRSIILNIIEQDKKHLGKTENITWILENLLESCNPTSAQKIFFFSCIE